jgi:hypothetical protein
LTIEDSRRAPPPAIPARPTLVVDDVIDHDECAVDRQRRPDMIEQPLTLGRGVVAQAVGDAHVGRRQRVGEHIAPPPTPARPAPRARVDVLPERAPLPACCSDHRIGAVDLTTSAAVAEILRTPLNH